MRRCKACDSQLVRSADEGTRWVCVMCGLPYEPSPMRMRLLHEEGAHLREQLERRWLSAGFPMTIEGLEQAWLYGPPAPRELP